MENKTKIITIILCIFLSIIMILAVAKNEQNTISNECYLRIHIRANSNSQKDQDIKYKIKECLVEYLTVFLVDCKTKQNAMIVIEQKKDYMQKMADDILKENGFSYSSNIKINNEYFPTRSYFDKTLEEGYYDAVIVELGSASGDNWWCVVYPPLCFVDFKSTYSNVIYKSKLWEIINSFFG